MPLTRSQARAGKAAGTIETCTFPYNGQTVTMHYRKSVVTKNWLAQFQEIQEKADDGVIAADMALVEVGNQLAEMIAWWDVTEDDGKTMIPIAGEILASDDFGLEFMMAAIYGIGDDIRKKNPTSRNGPKGSRGGSSQTARGPKTSRPKRGPTARTKSRLSPKSLASSA